MPEIEVKIFKKPEIVIEDFAQEFYRFITNSQQKRFDIALSGGSTPKLLFQHLSDKYKEKIPWQRLHFWWGDERCVAPDGEESNYRMTMENLLSKIRIPEENIHRIKGENEPVSEAESYSKQMLEQLNTREDMPVFDLIVLGMGKDGHTASIFPHEMHLLKSDKVCEVATHPETGQKRITLTGRVLNNAHRIFFLITGKGKAKRIAQIMNDLKKAKKLPAYFIEPRFGYLIWFLDQAAGEKIS